MATKVILVGGFLGAGKTTLLLETGRRLTQQGLRVGLVTNDQGEQLVDTALASDADMPVTEVAGGCFCCRFPDLVKALRKLQQTVQPDVILAEPVGSCTDLVATVLRPLSFYYGEFFTLAPLTVLAGANHNLTGFSARVDYLYEKQVAEAEIILLSKRDLLTTEQTTRRLADLRAQYPTAQVQSISAHDGDGIDAWLAKLHATPSRLHPALDVDYAAYAEAEAELGWLNMRGTLTAGAPFPPQTWMAALLQALSHALAQREAPIAHLKMRLQTPRGVFKASITSTTGALTWDSFVPHLLTDRAQFTLNLRAAAAPSALEETVRDQLDEAGTEWQMRYDVDHFECFHPAPPQPTYRFNKTA